MVEQEDGGPWTHGTVVGRGDHNHNNKSYTVSITKTGCFIPRNCKHIKTAHITVEQIPKGPTYLAYGGSYGQNIKTI